MIKPLPRKEPKKPAFKFNLLQKILILLVLVILALTALPVVVILLIGLLPTLTVLLTDSKNTGKLTIVGCFNLAGIFICLTDIFNQYSVSHSISILSNIFNIVIMLGAAALGMVLYYELPNLFVLIFKSSAQRRLRSIDAKLEKIAADWGRDSIGDTEK